MTNTRNYGLDVMRVAAITLVVLSHFSVKNMDILGLFGVELFFVLSGYLIGGILLKQILTHEVFAGSDLRAFFQRRWFRTLPNYFLFLAIYFCAGILMPSMFPSPIYLWRFLIFLQNFISAPPIFYMISWSLAVEEWFYLIFPLLFFVLYRLSGLKRQSFLTATIIIMLLPLCARFYFHPSGNWSFSLRMVVVYRLDALMYGVFLAFIHHEYNGIWKKMKPLFWLAIVVLVANFFMLRHVFPLGKPVVPLAIIFSEIPLVSACLIPFLTELKNPAVRRRLIVENISKWSYSIYLSHFAVLFLFYGFTAQFSQGTVAKLLVKATALLTSVLVSALIYRYYEKPIMDLGRKWSRTKEDHQIINGLTTRSSAEAQSETG